MKMIRKITLILVVGSVCAISNAFAGGMLTTDGSISTKDSTEMMPIDDVHIIIRSKNSGTVSLGDESHPMQGASGNCSGTMLMAKGKLSGNGYCTYKDLSGDTSIVLFTATAMNEKGGTSGTWQLVGGTGKYSNASGGGNYNAIPNEDRTASVNTISGEITLN